MDGKTDIESLKPDTFEERNFFVDMENSLSNNLLATCCSPCLLSIKSVSQRIANLIEADLWMLDFEGKFKSA